MEDKIIEAFKAGINWVRNNTDISEYDGWRKVAPHIDWPYEARVNQAARDYVKESIKNSK